MMIKIISLIWGALCIAVSLPLSAADYNYDVSGYGDTGYVEGEIDAHKESRDVEGYVVKEDGTETQFEGEWTGYGKIEGYDEDGNYYELEVD